MIHDPVVIVECDQCGMQEEHGLTVTARGWDDRGLEDGLRRSGWTVEKDGIVSYCPECTEQRKEGGGDDGE